MNWATWKRTPVFIAALLLAMNSPCAHSETTREACERTSPDNASLRRCMIDMTTKETSALEGKACSSRRCVIKMSGCKDLKNETSCESDGYKVKFRSIETGTEIEITDDRGRITNMSRCGSCTELDYDDGPLKDAKIRYGTGFIILDVPK